MNFLLLVNFTVLLVLFTVKISSAVVRECETDTFGTNFVFGFIENKQSYKKENIHLHITPILQLTAHVRVTAPFLIVDRTYTLSNFTAITLNGTLIQQENGVQFKGIEITSNVNITVTAFTGRGSENCVDCLEGFLPTNALGTRYITASYVPYSSYNSEFLVAGIESDTDVVMNISINGRMSNRTIRLQKFETFQFTSNNDVTGSIITSNKPVAVFAGSAGAEIPIGLGDYQYIVEQMIPTKYWTTKYIVPPIYPRKYFVLKFFADHDKTEVHYYNSTNHYAVYMDKGSIVETLFGTDPVTVMANYPISVMQYGHDGDNINGDPFMMTAQGVHQFANTYDFLTQSYYNNIGSNTLALTITKENASELVLNGQSISSWTGKNVSVAYPMGQYLTLFVNVSSNGSYRLSHKEGVKFGAVLYGRPASTGAYGYPLQLSLSNSENCTSTSQSTVATQGPTDPGYTSKPLQTTNETGYGKWCFRCEDITHLKYCDAVQRCQNENEVCYVQSYTRKLGVNLFKSGCINTEQCYNTTNVGCLQCCKDNFCNSAGCGDYGFQGLGNRGPLCMDCSHIGENEMCNNVQLCHSDQACVIEKYEWGDNDFQYYMGCTQPQVCTSKRSIGDRTDRNVPVCSHCCHSDFCNLNCTSVDLGPAIVG